mmetsp:Transcript_16721/g.40000  ORF Transcript_16721/g.40000 Transcript_16721/m.40000 type:complete len:174 (-) Transcript_16721:1306-1827(-)
MYTSHTLNGQKTCQIHSTADLVLQLIYPFMSSRKVNTDDMTVTTIPSTSAKESYISIESLFSCLDDDFDNDNWIQNNGGSTNPAMATQKHPMKLTTSTKPEPKNAENIVQVATTRTLTTILLCSKNEYRIFPSLSTANNPNSLPSINSPQGIAIRGPVSATTPVMRMRTMAEM